MKTPARILLVKPSSLGDVIHALPVVSAIRNHWPKAELRWLIDPTWRSLVEGNPGVSDTILFPRDRFRGPAGWLRSIVWLRILREWKPDLAIDLQGLLRSAIFARISGACRVLGLSDSREGARFLHGKRAEVDSTEHAVRRYLSVLDPLGISQPRRPEFLLPIGKLPVGFDPSVPYITIHPYARGVGKSLSPEMIRAFASGAKGTRVVIVGMGESLTDLPSNVEDWSRRTNLLELIGILREASFIVSSDSGPMHLAVALQPSRTLAIHLWSDPLRVGPFFPESLVWKDGRLKRVLSLDDSWRAPGRPPNEVELEQLGRGAAAEIVNPHGGFPG